MTVTWTPGLRGSGTGFPQRGVGGVGAARTMDAAPRMGASRCEEEGPDRRARPPGHRERPEDELLAQVRRTAPDGSANEVRVDRFEPRWREHVAGPDERTKAR